jgi:ABC-type transport system substrate-binding protein
MRRALEIGATVAGFRLEAVLGSGGSGVVYRARGDDGRLVALKVLDPVLADDDRFRARFLREAALAARLDHPNAVRVVASGEDAGVLFIAMSFVDGPDLRTLIRTDGSLAPERALALLAGVADALDAAHAIGLVHRDVTPGNIMVGAADGRERACLGDFGLARHASTPITVTGDRSFAGTIDYLAPEQIRGDPLDARADQYALACVLYACLTGAPPFARDSEVATVFAHLNERPAPVSAVAPALSPALDGVLARGLAKDPAERFGSCRQLIATGEAALRARTPARRGRRGVALAAAAVVLAGAAVAAGTYVAGGRHPAVTRAATSTPTAGGTHPTPIGVRLDVDAVALVDPARRRVLGQVRLPGEVTDLVLADRAAWALLGTAGRLLRLDSRSGRITASLTVPFAPGAAAASGADVWVTEAGGPGLVRVDGASARLAARITVPERAGAGTAIAVAAGSLWLGRGAAVLRVEPRSGRVLARFATPRNADLLVAGPDVVWVASSNDGLLYEIDPVANRITARTRLHAYVTDLAVGGGAAWVAVTPEDRIYRIDPDDGSVQGSVAAGAGPESVAYANGALIVANGRERALSRVAAESGERTAIPTASSPMLVRARDGVAWVASVAPPAVLPVRPAGGEVRVALPGDELAMDPATGFGPVNVQLAYETCLRLETYADAAGAAGRELVPDGALGAPAVSADGSTYVYRIRPGLRFSAPSGAAITAETFRATLERALSPKLGPDTPAPVMLADVVGLAAYRAGRAEHVSGIAVAGDRLAITIARPSGDLRERLALPFACVVPPATPALPGGIGTPLASAGPYRIASHGPGRTILVRNEAYRGTRPRGPVRIVYETGIATARAVAMLEDRRIDYVPYDYDGSGPLAQGGDLDRRFGPASDEARQGRQRFYHTPAPGLDLLVFNTRRGLFRDVALRRAVNAALDRPAIAAVWGEDPSDRYVPPAVLPSANGSTYPVSGADVARARRLAHGVRGAAALYFCGGPENRRVVAIVRANLAAIGIRVRPVPSLGCTLGHDPKLDHADLMLISPATPLLDPAPFIEAALGRESVLGQGMLPVRWWDDAALRRAIDRARPLQGAARDAAYAALERRLLDEAVPFAALGSWTAPEYVSPRLGCRLAQGVYGLLDLGAACTRAAAA